MSAFSSGPEAVVALGELLIRARRILVFTGAGISTASGIPDFRGPEGVWNTRRPVYYSQFMRSDAARRMYWQQKMEDRGRFGSADPNEVHRAVAQLEAAGVVEMVVTQNIDGLHRRAGTSRERLVEVHGTSAEIECQTCGELSDPAPHYSAFAASGEAPVCHCGGFLKPATISFGQSLRPDDLQRALDAAGRADLVLALGSTMTVEPAASIPLVAAERGVPYAIVNRGRTEHDGLTAVTLRIEDDVSEVVPEAVALVLTR
jgi:NAD-dependent deacetylase